MKTDEQKRIDDGKYEKFLVISSKEGSSNAVPWTGMDCVLSHVKDLLEAGFSVKIVPFTRRQWAKEDET